MTRNQHINETPLYFLFLGFAIVSSSYSLSLGACGVHSFYGAELDKAQKIQLPMNESSLIVIDLIIELDSSNS